MKKNRLGLFLLLLSAACLSEDNLGFNEDDAHTELSLYEFAALEEQGLNDLQIPTQALTTLDAGTVFQFEGLAFMAEEKVYRQASIHKTVSAPQMQWGNMLSVMNTDIEIDYIAQPRINAAYYVDSHRPFIAESCAFIIEGYVLPQKVNIGERGDGMAFTCPGLEVMHSWAFLQSEDKASVAIYRQKILRIIQTADAQTFTQYYLIDSYLSEDGEIQAIKISLTVNGELKYSFRSTGL